jgi:hypothetical protein
MTSRERILAAFRCDTPDRVPVSPFGLGRVAADSAVGRELIEKTDILISPGLGGNPFLGAWSDTESFTEDGTTTTVYHTPVGDLTRVHRRTDIASATVSFPCATPDDVDKLLSIPYEPPEIQTDAFFEWKERLGDQGLVLAGLGDAICIPATWFSPEDFAFLWADAPDAMQRLVDVAADRLNDYVTRACALGIDGWRIVGGEYASVQLGPTAFDALVKEPDRELVDIMHRHDAVAYFHNHGPSMAYLTAFADIGIDALDPLEAPPWGDCDLAEAKKALRGRVCIVGNLDDMEIVEQLDRDAVQEIARERIAQAGADGFCLGGTASGTYTERAARNFIALVDVAREYAARTT